MKKTVLVIFGGTSTEHEISCISASFVSQNIDREIYDVVNIGVTSTGSWYLYDGDYDKMADNSWETDVEHLIPAVLSPCPKQHGLLVLDKVNFKFSVKYIDVAFPVLHGRFGEDGTMQGLLTLAGIPFVGCGTYASAVTMDKAATKIICERDGIPTTPFILIRDDGSEIKNHALKAEKTFSYPIFVKPVNFGSSVGITKAKNFGELVAGIEKAFEYDSKVLLEKCMNGKEIEVAVLGNQNPIVSVCAEITPNADFYDFDTKYNNDNAKITLPANIPEKVSTRVRATALKVYNALDCKGMSRIDFFVDGDKITLNEVNTIPGFTAISMYPKLLCYGENAYTPKTLMSALIDLAYDTKR